MYDFQKETMHFQSFVVFTDSTNEQIELEILNLDVIFKSKKFDIAVQYLEYTGWYERLEISFTDDVRPSSVPGRVWWNREQSLIRFI